MNLLLTIGIVTLMVSFEVQVVYGNTKVTQTSTGGLKTTTVQTTVSSEDEYRGPATKFEDDACPTRFCKHVSYECDVSCTENGTDCDLSNCGGYHHCSSGYTIPVSEVCDGVAQCRYKDDELQCGQSYQPNCACSGLQIKCNNFSPEIIKDLPLFSSMSIILFPNGNNPSSVQLKYTTYIVMKMCRMDSFVLNHSTSLKGLLLLSYINFSFNRITKLPDYAFSNLSSLSVLHLGYNLISTLPVKVFRGLSKLRYLTLEGNLISIIPDNVFAGLNRLEILQLHYNSISTLSFNVFSDLSRLTFVALYGNDITTLHYSLFNALHRLSILFLSDNSISTIPANVFSDLSYLKRLYLSGNRISVLPIKVFNGLSSLEYLHLDNNRISNIPHNAFNDLPRLRILKLNHNMLIHIHVVVFRSLNRLQDLNMEHNRISKLDANVFYGLYSLTHLNVLGNMISVLPLGVFNGLPRLSSLDLRNNTITEFRNASNDLPNLDNLYLSYNSIAVLHTDAFNDLSRLVLNGNKITNLQSNVFKGLYNLVSLQLNNNLISSISAHAFNYLHKLGLLDLSSNKISSLPRNIFSRLLNVRYILMSNNNLMFLPSGLFTNNRHLRTLNIYGNELRVQERMFHGLDSLENLMTDSELVCCVKPTSVKNCMFSNVYTCTFQNYGCTDNSIEPISSCIKLVYSDALTVCLWVIGLFALLGNGFVTCYRVVIDRENIKKAQSVFLINLSISDFLTGVYMIIIGSANAYYHGIYAWNSQIWRSSWLCVTGGILAMVSSEMSAFLICMITIDRFIAIVFPFSGRCMTWKQAIGICIMLWVLSVTIAIIPQLFLQSYFKGEFYSQSGVCFALPLTSEQQPGVEYSVSIFIGLNGVIFVFVFFAQICIYRSMKQSGQAASSINNKRDQAVARILIAVVITDLLCWCPIAVMGLMVRLGEQLHPSVYPWVMIIVIPVNAAINPILYTGVYIWRQRESEKKRRELLQLQNLQPPPAATTTIVANK